MKKIGMFWDEIDTQKNLSIEEKFVKVGLNTGNLIFIESLKSILHPTILPRWSMGNNNYFNSEDFDAFVTTDLIWLQEGVEYPHVEKMLRRIGDKKLVPISVGIQAPRNSTHVNLHPNTVHLLEEISERCVLGLRGEFTEHVLSKHGIKNTQIIGCPSMYYKLRDNYEVTHQTLPEWPRVICTFRTFFGKLSKEECHFLTYAANNNWRFVEQTQHRMTLKIANGNPKMFAFLNSWIEKNEKIFFNAEEWMKWAAYYDMAVGSRFHGNVVSILNNKPALFFVADNRMNEMCRLFHLPTMLVSEFDESKPVQYYYEKADYSEFNKNYPMLQANFIDFLKKNGLWE